MLRAIVRGEVLPSHPAGRYSSFWRSDLLETSHNVETGENIACTITQRVRRIKNKQTSVKRSGRRCCTVHGHVELIEFLHVHGADITMADEYGATPLHYASLMCAQQHRQPVSQAQRDNDDKSRDDDDFTDGVKRLDVQRAVLMRTEIVDCVDQQYRTPLVWAATCGILVTSSKLSSLSFLCFCWTALCMASTPYKRWSKCTGEKVGGDGFFRNLGEKIR